VALTRTPQGANKDLIPLLELALRSESGPARTYVVRRFLPASGIRDDRLLNAIHERLMNPRAEMGEREYALSLLARWGDPRSLPVFAEIVRRGGAKTGAAIGGLIAAGGEHLEAVLKSLGHPRSAAEVAKALARCMDNPRVSAFVRSALTSPSEDLRRGAQLVVGNVPETAGAFVPPAEHLRSSVRGGSQAWRERLAALPKADATQAATALLKDADAAVRAAAAAMLGMLKAPSAVPALIQALADPSVSVRAQAGEALGALGDRQATAAVLRALQDPEAGVREAAAVALGQLADPLALDSLLKVLDSPDWQLRRAAAQGLGGFPDARAGQALQRLGRSDPHWCVRRTAVSALGRRGDKSVAPALIWALEDEHWSVRSSAHESLVAVTSQKFGDSPEAWRAWWARQPGAQARPGKRD
jgi:HEAT repeat protein